MRGSPLCCSFPLYIYIFLSLHLSLLFPHTSNTFLIGCRSANNLTWLNGPALSVSRQIGCSCSGYFSIQEKKKDREREASVWGRGVRDREGDCIDKVAWEETLFFLVCTGRWIIKLSAEEQNNETSPANPSGTGDKFKITLLLNHRETGHLVSATVQERLGYFVFTALCGLKPHPYMPLQHVRLQNTIIDSAWSIHHTSAI